MYPTETQGDTVEKVEQETLVLQGSRMEVAIRMLHPSHHNHLLRTAHNRLADHEVLVHPLLASNAPRQGHITQST